jgi:hypothetical protein
LCSPHMDFGLRIGYLNQQKEFLVSAISSL